MPLVPVGAAKNSRNVAVVECIVSDSARQILAANWHPNAPPHANTTPRIAFLRRLIALLESQPARNFPWPASGCPLGHRLFDQMLETQTRRAQRGIPHRPDRRDE